MGSTRTSFNITGFLGIKDFYSRQIYLRKYQNQSSVSFFVSVLCNVHLITIIRMYLNTMYMSSNYVCVCMFFLCELMNTFSLMYIETTKKKRKKCYFPLYSGLFVCVCVFILTLLFINTK